MRVSGGVVQQQVEHLHEVVAPGLDARVARVPRDDPAPDPVRQQQRLDQRVEVHLPDRLGTGRS